MGVKISNLPSVVTPALTDVFPIAQGGVTYKETVTQLAALVAASTGAALTKTDDTNVTLTLGGSPTIALLNPASLTLGWTGTLSVARGGTGAANLNSFLLTTSAAGQTTTMTLSTATPNNDSLIGATVLSNSVVTSGLAIGLLGAIGMVGASGGTIMGTAGQIVPTGTLSGTLSCAAIYGILNMTGATINGGDNISVIRGNWTSAAAVATDLSKCHGFSFTNPTVNVLGSQIHLVGDATNLLEVASATTYFPNAGAGANSAGAAAYAAGTKVLQISVNGTLYYIRCYTSNA